MLGMGLPGYDRPRVGWREDAPGQYTVWCAADIADTPWWCGDEHAGAPVVHWPGGRAVMTRWEPGVPTPGRLVPAWTAAVTHRSPRALFPLWFGGPRAPTADERPYVLSPALARLAGTTDVHAHLGRLNGEDYAPALMAELLAEAHVGRAWVSNLDGATFTQADTNRRVLELVAGQPALQPVFWANPVEGLSADVEALLADPRFVGLKFHPELNIYPADDARLDPYLERAAERGFFALFHTDQAENSTPERLARLAARHPRVKFVAGHMGLWGAQARCLQVIRESKAQNIYGDLAWFHRWDLLADEIGAGRDDRFVFGSDAPVDGEESYQQYLWVLHRMGADASLLERLFVTNPRTLTPGC